MPDDARGLPPGHAMQGAGVVNVANIITLGRLCLVPVAVWLVLEGQTFVAFWLFLAAGASDAVDGWLARRRGPTAVGALLDPVADKALLVSMYVTLAAIHVLPNWLAILVVFRDVLIVGGVLALSVLGMPVEIRPLMVSKLNTVLQIVLVAVALLHAGLGVSTPILPALVWLVTASTLASGAAYAAQAARTR
ncbi:MAG: CDP-alcohol phosphatidyltransferase family protein [Rhodospirillales bacterium]|nr:CDP-alcohol phosphatidyltransferase family protein [Rhodospirillales bacterium]